MTKGELELWVVPPKGPPWWRPMRRWRHRQELLRMERESRLIAAGIDPPDLELREAVDDLVDLVQPEMVWAREHEERLRMRRRWEALANGDLAPT